MLKTYRADLHIHTVLSPCGELEQSPGAVAGAAKQAGLHLAAITDHNSVENAGAYGKRLQRESVAFLPGLEVCTSEEVHILGLFDDLDAAFTFQGAVYQRLEGENDPDAFGMQVLVNEEEDVLGFNDRLLIGACTLSLHDAVRRIRDLGGLAVACHVDREGFSLIGQLGFVPPGLDLDALEISRRTTLDDARARIPDTARFPLIRSSDAHKPEDVGSAWTEFLLEAPTVGEIRKALAGSEGRRITGYG
jgi:PHP family Zn ribbon phosphoesterase